MWSKDVFVGRVQVKAHLASRDEADAVTRAALKTLGECLGNRANVLAGELPWEVGRYLRRDEDPQQVGVREFLARVHRQSKGERAVSDRRTMAVFEVLSEAVTPGIYQSIRDALPAGYYVLFEQPPVAKGAWEFTQ